MGMQTATASLGRPLGTGREWRRRLLLHHVPLALTSAVLLVVFMKLPPFTDNGYALLDMGGSSPLPEAGTHRSQGDGRTFESAFTLGTGYVATVLLALTLLIGPANLLLRRRNPVSTSLARDTGTWAAILSIVHVVIGLKVHGNAGELFNYVTYFFYDDGTPKGSSFGLGNWVGLAALVIVTGLLAISSDGALRELKAKRWKSLQRLNYALFALVVLHVFFYGAFLRTTSPFTLTLISTTLAVLAGQTAGIWLWRRRNARHDRTATR